MSSKRGYEEILEEVFSEGSIDLYGEAAPLFDLAYSGRDSMDRKEESARSNVEKGSDVLDLACGTGIVAELMDEDYNVTGADISRDMLEVAKEKNLNSEFVQADMTDLPFYEEFDAVLMYGQPLSHITDRSKVQQAAESIYQSLKSDGFLVTDFFTPDTGEVDELGRVETRFDDNHRIAQTWNFSNYDSERNTWDARSTFWIERYNMMTNLEDRRQLRGYSMDEMREILSDAGFSTVEEEEIYPAEIYNGVKAFR
ncbi:MAG: class I SAM-dependent methyltransferase [Candidatus Nanosalina sp.]